VKLEKTPLRRSRAPGWYVRGEGLPLTGPFETQGEALRFALSLGFRGVIAVPEDDDEESP